ncbi:2-oxoglutarate (2OG) and Fe(II)-dependent oxygenase superfamily protein [Abeliophyllum distichum]|uniref:2-oxoglutarate (2OG) and Fe(II)-dependent oxygenase superfamily protein n=1 Tax=Abeliophyllum distichum TaxID=126358 RepID=A0ABD1RRC7_9LAMI
MEGVKVLSESSAVLKSVPSKFNFVNEPTALNSDSIPIIDFSLLTSGHPHQRSRFIQELGKACQEWGFFILVNHGIPENEMKAMFEAATEFFNMPAEEKLQYEPKNASDPIKCGNFNVTDTSNHTFTLWRDYLKLYVHPEFHCPLKPDSLREALLNYSERTRKLARALLEAISETLELEKGYMEETLNLESLFQLFAANWYPPCPQPDRAIGIPPHTDHGLLTFLIHNGVAGLQIQHNGDWFNVNSPQNSILVNTSDQLEIFSNGRCKSLMHRAVLNNEKTRISIVVANGPSPNAIVGPAQPLAARDGRASYLPMKYMEYIEKQLTKSQVNGKSILEQMMIQDEK